MVSLVIATEDGKTVEVGEVGREGFSGIQAAVGINRNQVREIVQIAGDGFRVRIGALKSVLQSAPELQRLLIRYAVIQGMQFAQTAACNRLHNIEQRLARWLLITQDRVDSATLAITHDFLATMLGTDRPTVSLAAGTLLKKQIIDYTRGAVQILSRTKLEESACECYEVIQQYNREIGLK
jgi:CRP-like cAMP-binding protein